ncbi:Acyl-CoA dehydrogenase family member 10 [Spathaspora sp. JA1]|nr:Acyl-CoA dehydrogenase family member 10 [Spathaspora sp. JA1]
MSAPELTDVRAPIDLDELSVYLTSHLQSHFKTTIGHNAADMSNFNKIKIQQFTFGQSNPTYLITDTQDNRYVLRRKPSPNAKLISRSAHAVEREFFVLNAINVINDTSDLKVPVPRVHLLCEDEGVIGYVFYIMDYVNGIQIKNPSMPGVSANDAKYYWDSIVETIAGIHSLDAERLIGLLPEKHFPQFQNLEKLKNTSYFKRQIKTLNSIHKLQSQHVKTIPHFKSITEWLLTNAPNDPEKLTLIHGDLKIDNILFDPNTKKVCGILDWELCTIGNPLFDLANFFQPFQLPNRLNKMLYYPQETDMGNENPESLNFLYKQLKKYQGLITWDRQDPRNNPTELWPIGHVFGLLRLCVISQGIAMRVKLGNASSANAKGYAGMYPYLAELASETSRKFNVKNRESKV